jgi:hypothetical protein
LPGVWRNRCGSMGQPVGNACPAPDLGKRGVGGGCTKDRGSTFLANSGLAQQLGVALFSLEAFVAFAYSAQRPALLPFRSRDATRRGLETPHCLAIELGEQAVIVGERLEGFEQFLHFI